jgi:oligopeptidase A
LPDAILVIDDAIYKLNYIWGLVHHLSSVLDSNEIRAIQEKYTTIITQFYLDLAQNEALFDLYQQLKLQPLDLEYSKVVSNSLLDFKLNGFNLSESDKAKFNQIVTKLDKLTTKFAQNVLDSTESSAIYLKLENENKIK